MTPKQVFYDYALRLVNTPYIWGGDDFDGVDCSGLVILLLQSVGLFPYRQDARARDLYERFKSPAVQPVGLGTLFFYGNEANGITHVNMALNSLQVIGAEGGGSKTLTAADAAKQNAFVKILPIGFRGPPIAVARPNYPWGNE